MFRLNKTRTVLCCMLLLVGLSSAVGRGAAQIDAQYFPQTGKTVSGRFLEYWSAQGGVEQYGYPISEVLSEQSEVDGKIYTVQYFERAVFELHPENTPPYDVLLSLLGRLLYNQKYPTGAPSQEANTSPGSRLFRETGKHVGDSFLSYWTAHGGLAQQGFPISEEFIEVSELEGRPYKVQYFERAVFEYHPENAGTRYEVLLSQLGRFHYQARSASGTLGSSIPQPPLPPSRSPTPLVPTATTTNTPDPTRTPSATATPVKATSTPVKPPSKVVAIGDSVMLGGAAELKRLISNIEIDTAVSRQVAAGIAILKTRRDTGRLGDVVIFHLGNNGTFTTQQFDQIMQVLVGVSKVVFVNVKVPRSWEQTDNAVIATGVKRYPKAVLVDWYAASINHPDYFAKDGYHLTTKGAKLYSELIAGSLGSK